MARRSSAAHLAPYRFQPRAPAPIVRVVSRAAPRKKHRRSRRRSSSVGSVAGFNLDYALGGLLYGFAVKSGLVQKLPAIPVIGRTGTAALALGFWAKRGGGEYVRKAAVAAAVLTGYQFGSTGAVTGDADSWEASGLETMGMDTMGDDDDIDGDDDDVDGDDDDDAG